MQRRVYTFLAIAGIGLLAVPPSSAQPGLGALTSRSSLPGRTAPRLGTTDLRHGGPIRSLVFSPDGRLLISAGGDHFVRTWEVPRGKQILQIQDNWVCCVACAPSGRFLASGNDLGEIRIWSTLEAKLVARSSANHRSRIVALAFHPAGELVASASWDGELYLWDVETGKSALRLTARNEPPALLAFDETGRTLLLVNQAGTIHRWQIPGGRQLAEQQTGVRSASWVLSPDGHCCAAASNGEVAIWKLMSEGKRLTSRSFRGCMHALALGREASFLAIAKDSQVQILRLTDGQEFNIPTHAQEGMILTISGDNELLAMADRHGAISIWDLAAKSLLTPARGHCGPVISVGVERGSKVVTSLCAGGVLCRWDSGSGAELVRRRVHTSGSLWKGLVSNDGKLLFIADVNSLRSIGTESGHELWRLALSPGNLVNSLCLVDHGNLLAVARESQNIELRSTTGGVLISTIANGGSVKGLAAAPSGNRMAAVDAAGVMSLWRINAGKEEKVAVGRDVLPPLAFSPDGLRLATAGRDGLIRVWDAESGQEIRHLAGHSDSVAALLFTAGGRELVTAGADGRIRIWEVATGREFRQSAVQPSRVSSLAVDPARHRAFAGSSDGSIIVWDLHTPAAKGAADQLNGPGLEKLWMAMASPDGPTAHDAIHTLVAIPGRVPALIRSRLGWFIDIDTARIEQLIRELDSDDFRTRERATRELGKLGELAAPALRKSLARSPSAEARRRLEQILLDAKGPAPTWNVERVRILRALQVLQAIGTKEARELLSQLTKSGTDDDLKAEARLCLAGLSTYSN